MPSISTFPPSYPIRWTIPIDSIIVGSRTISLSSNVTDAPSNIAIALVDTGTSFWFVDYHFIVVDLANDLLLTVMFLQIPLKEFMAMLMGLRLIQALVNGVYHALLKLMWPSKLRSLFLNHR